MVETFKRETANKLRIGDLIKSKAVYQEAEGMNRKLDFVEINGKSVRRINIIGIVIDKFKSEGERIFGSITLDDGSGQVRARLFGEECNKFDEFTQGDTVLIIGLLRAYNEEVYIIPEIMKKQDPRYLLIRKLEIDKMTPKQMSTEQKTEAKEEVKAIRDDIISVIKSYEDQEGINKEDIQKAFSESKPEIVTKEIQKLMEDGIIYEPKPGRVRYLG